MRKILSVFIAACLVLSLCTGIFVSMPSARADITEGDYTYTVAGSEATITKYTGAGGAVVIPDTLGGGQVTSIGGGAFAGCTSLTSVTTPVNLYNIGDAAFQGCAALTSVTFERKVSSIGERAFQGCEKMTADDFHTGADITEGDYTLIFVNNTATITKYTGAGGAVVIPSTLGGNPVTSIGGDAFGGCTSLTSVTIPNRVTTIGVGAFQACTGLTSVTGGSGVTSIGNGAFYSCGVLTSVTIGSGITSIGDNAFYGCAPGFIMHSARDTTTGTSGQTGRNKWSKIILISIIFLIALLIIFGIRFAIQRQAN